MQELLSPEKSRHALGMKRPPSPGIVMVYEWSSENSSFKASFFCECTTKVLQDCTMACNASLFTALHCACAL